MNICVAQLFFKSLVARFFFVCLYLDDFIYTGNNVLCLKTSFANKKYVDDILNENLVLNI